MPGPVAHTAVAAAVGGAVWAATGEPMAMPVAFGAGVLIDVDHVLDYYNWYFRRDRRYTFLVFHAWEYAAAGLALAAGVWQHPLAFAAVLGYIGHLTLDNIANPVNRAMYSLAYRAWRRFDRKVLIFEERTLQQTLRRYIPLWERIEPLAMRLPAYCRAVKAIEAENEAQSR
ncbi:MAG: hypothetical protein FJ312_02300 [SAR202 cluster bacterium]|nr:hypothetical protein [SAR202 cluster bacterium]